MPKAAIFCLHKFARHNRRKRKRPLEVALGGGEDEPEASQASRSLTTSFKLTNQIHHDSSSSVQLELHSSEISRTNNQQAQPTLSARLNATDDEMHELRDKPPAASGHRGGPPKRRRLATASGALLLLLTSLQLICDISGSSRQLIWGAQAMRQQQAASANSDSGELLQKPLAFLVEPRDMEAAVGQARSLSCVAPSKPAGRLMWYKDMAFELARDLELVLSSSMYYSVSLERLTSEQLRKLQDEGDEQAAADSSSVVALGQEAASSSSPREIVALKYTLHISNVTLADDNLFHCLLDTGAETVASRQARLHVLAPPTQLEVRHLRDHNSAWQDQPIQEVEVRQNEMVALECRSIWAKPHAELAWLDDNQAPVSTTTANSAAYDSEQAPVSYTERFVRLMNDTQKSSGGGGGLREETRLVWHFRASRDQHNRLFTCVTRHAAYALYENKSSIVQAAWQRPLERAVRLSVLYEPEVELTREPLQPHEFGQVQFHCQAHARPPVQRYSWLIDDQLIANASEPRLLISSLTRQLHLREIRCQATNALATTSANVTRLAVKYAPAYVTHLLPASLQPERLASASVAFGRAANSTGSGGLNLNDDGEQDGDSIALQQQQQQQFEQLESGNFKRSFAQLDQQLAAELALGVQPETDVTLRCDFDSNPQPAQVLWFKVNTDFSTQLDVTPEEADSLIAYGANHAIFKQQQQQQQATLADDIEQEADGDDENTDPQETFPRRIALLQGGGAHAQTNKRHISIEHALDEAGEQSTNPTGLSESTHHQQQNWRFELDYERMSRELLSDMRTLELKQAQLLAQATNQSESQGGSPLSEMGKLIEPVPSDQVLPISQTIVTIEEPLEFKLLAGGAAQRRRTTTTGSKASQLRNQATQIATRRVAGVQELVLLAPSSKQAAAWRRPTTSTRLHQFAAGSHWRQPNKLQGRQAQLTSSSLLLKRVDGSSMGRYICLARGQPGFNSSAKSIYLVLQQQPRIISSARQWAPLGARTIQVECLVQINAVQDNQTQLIWSKDGQVFDSRHHLVQNHKPLATESGGGEQKNVTIIEELSPDALFIRSTLRISGADFSDFGAYNCTVINSLRKPDQLIIQLNPSSPTGVTLNLMACVTVGTIVLIATIACFVLAMDLLCKRFDKSALVTRKQIIKSDKKTISLEGAISNGAPLASDKLATSLDSAANLTPLESQRANGTHSLQRPASAFGGVGGSYATQQGAHFNSTTTTAVSSFRRNGQLASSQRNCASQHQATVSRSGHFAAIHESLEHKLQAASSGQRAPSCSSSSCSTFVQPSDELDASSAKLAHQVQGAGLMGRLRARLVGAGPSSQQKRSRRPTAQGKRPVISLPVQQGDSDANLKRLSSSLTLVVAGGEGQHHERPQHVPLAANNSNKQLMMMMHHLDSQRNSHQLVSSSANLIQDSASGSEAAAGSSGRSSSTSNPAQVQGGQMQASQFFSQAAPSYGNAQMNAQYGVATSTSLGLREWGPESNQHLAATSGPCDSSSVALYANGAHQQQMAFDYSQQQQQQVFAPLESGCIYANEHYQLDPTGVYGQQQQAPAGNQINWPPASHLSDQHLGEQQMSGHLGHYQMPALMSEPYLAAASMMQQQSQQPPAPPQLPERPTAYATICSHAKFQQQQQPAAVLVATSDAGEAFFESNYGSLLSRSSAYKTLANYNATQPQQHHQQTTVASNQVSRPLHSTGSSVANTASSATSSSSSSASSSSCSASSSPAHAHLTLTSSNHLHQQADAGRLSTPRLQYAAELAATNMTNGVLLEEAGESFGGGQSKAIGTGEPSVRTDDLATHV